MIYTSLNRIKENILDRKWLYWRMYQKDEKSLIAECVNLEEVTPKKSAEYLEEEITALEGSGYVIVKLYQQPPKQGGNNTGNLNFFVRVTGNGTDEEPVKGNANNYNNFGMISGFYQQINDLNIKLMQKDNEAALKEIKQTYESKNQSTSVDPMLKELLGIAKVLIAPKMAMPNNNQRTTTERPINGPEEKKEFAEAIKAWHEVDKDYLDAIKAIVFFAKNDYDSYRSNIDLLINAYKNQHK